MYNCRCLHWTFLFSSQLSLYHHRALGDRFSRLCGISAEQEYQGRTCPGLSVSAPQGDDRPDRFSGVERWDRGRVWGGGGCMWGVLPQLILFSFFSLSHLVSRRLYFTASSCGKEVLARVEAAEREAVTGCFGKFELIWLWVVAWGRG